MNLLLDENGNEIDLELVDAIGQLADGCYDVWLQNEKRVITRHPDAFHVWREFIRAKSRTSGRVSTAAERRSSNV